MTNEKMHTEGINEEGECEGFAICTYYNPCTGIIPADGYIRVIQDGEGMDYETRVDNALLIQAGWTPPSSQNAQSQATKPAPDGSR